MSSKQSRNIQSSNWWSLSRTRSAGVAAIVGAAIFLVHLLYRTYLSLQGLPWDFEVFGSTAWFLHHSALFVGFVGMALGMAAFRARWGVSESRLWRIGTALAVVGFTVAALGFLVLTVAPIIVPRGENLGHAVVGIGMMIGVILGTFLMGVYLLRREPTYRLLGVLLILVLPATLIAGPVGRMLGRSIVVATITSIPFIVAVSLIGYYLLTGISDEDASTA